MTQFSMSKRIEAPVEAVFDVATDRAPFATGGIAWVRALPGRRAAAVVGRLRRQQWLPSSPVSRTTAVLGESMEKPGARLPTSVVLFQQ